MGRYSTVQAYADDNAKMRSIPYEQAAGSAQPQNGTVKTEKVNNPYGSTAGAGSGEFHIYRHARAREAERWKQLNEAEKKKALEEEYKQTLEKYETEEQRKTEQRRKKRQREKEAKQKKKNLKLAGVNLEQQTLDVLEYEFTYVPLAKQKAKEERGNDEGKIKEDDAKPLADVKGKATPAKPPFANDGSFLEVIKRQLAEQGGSSEGPPVKKQATKLKA